MDKLSICNSALMRCGAEPILVGELATPTSKRGAAVVNQYETTLKDILSDSPWNFIIKKSKISIQSVAITSWSNVGKVVTLVVPAAHGFVANDVISVAGLSNVNKLKTITGWSYIGTAITLTVGSSHGFLANDPIVVSGLGSTTNPANGSFVVTSVTSTEVLFTAVDIPTGTATVSSAQVSSGASNPPNIDGVTLTSVGATTLVYTYTDTPTGTPTVVTATAFAKAGDLFGYKYRYALPADCIRVLELEDKVPYRIESTGIVCDQEGFIQIKYCFYNITPTTYSGAFVKALTLKLAEDISYLLVQSASLQAAIASEAERYLRKARSMNSQEGTPETRYPEEYTAGIRR